MKKNNRVVDPPQGIISAATRSSSSQPDRIDLKKILPRPGFEAGGDTTADDSSIGLPEGGVRKATSNEENSVLRQQLVAMETIYKNVQDLVGGGSGTLSGGGVGGGSKNGVDTIGSGSDEDPSKTSRLHQKSLKRLARLEGHVVTLARSVAHLSSELRSQHLLSQDIETIKETLKVSATAAADICLRRKFRRRVSIGRMRRWPKCAVQPYLFSQLDFRVIFQELKLEHGNRAKSTSQGNCSSERNSSWVASLANPHRYA